MRSQLEPPPPAPLLTLLTLAVGLLAGAADADAQGGQDGPGGQQTDPTEPRILTVRAGAANAPQVVSPGVRVEVVEPLPIEIVLEQPVAVPHQPYEPYEPPPRPWRRDEDGPIGSIGLWFDAISLTDVDLSFDDAGIEALRGQRLPAPGAVDLAAGGVQISSGYRPEPWIRAPEFRLQLGGGHARGQWARVAGSDGFEARADSLFVARFEIAAGFQPRIGDTFRPFLLGRVGYAGYFVNASVRHDALGELGSEDVNEGMFEAGVDAGFAVHLGDHWQLATAYRGTWGAHSRGHGFTVSFLIGDN